MTDTKQRKRTAFTAVIMALIALVILGSATYAWFTFSTTTNVTPMAGTIGTGGAELLISNRYDGDYGTEVELIFDSLTDELEPVSTADLENYYMATAQTADGISVRYKDVSDEIDNYIIRGSLYLKSEYGACNVYLDRLQTYFEGETQALASMRLGLKVTNHEGTQNYIFDLQDFTNSNGADSTRTVDGENIVVESISDRSPNYTSDPAIDIYDYAADTSDPDEITPANEILLQIDEDEIATVEFFVYLEGCDENCINSVQTNEIEMRLGFAGTKID